MGQSETVLWQLQGVPRCSWVPLPPGRDAAASLRQQLLGAPRVLAADFPALGKGQYFIRRETCDQGYIFFCGRTQLSLFRQLSGFVLKCVGLVWLWFFVVI